MARKGSTASKASAPSRGTAPKPSGRTPASSSPTRTSGRPSGEPWRDEPARAIGAVGAVGADELEGETGEEAEELELEDLSDDEEPEIPLPVEAPIPPEEDDSEW